VLMAAALDPRVADPGRQSHHAAVELWMAAYGHQIVSRSAGGLDWCEEMTADRAIEARR